MNDKELLISENKKIISDYRVMESDSRSILEKYVSDFLKDGYECVGGICLSVDRGYKFYCQAVIKYDKG